MLILYYVYLSLSTFYLLKTILNLVPQPGVEPGTYRLQICCSTQLSYCGLNLERVVRIELTSKGWKPLIITIIRYPQIGMRAGIRTPTNGFGDRCATINTTHI